MAGPDLPAVGGRTRVYGIVGDPVAQVRAPGALNRIWARRGVDAVMVPLHVPPEALETAVAGLRAMENFAGLVVTLPHKFAMARLVDSLAETARRVGAVNAIRREADGRWHGDMFDGRGFVAGLRAAGWAPRGRRALVVGAGGAGHAIAFALAEAGIAELVIADLDGARATALAGRVAAASPGVAARAGPAAATGMDLVVNATPAGLAAGDPLPVDVGTLRPETLVAEVVMEPAMTPLLRAAERRGCPVQPGDRLLAHQAPMIADFFAGAG